MLKEEFLALVLEDVQDTEGLNTLVIETGKMQHGTYAMALINLEELLKKHSHRMGVYGSIEKRFKLE